MPHSHLSTSHSGLFFGYSTANGFRTTQVFLFVSLRFYGLGFFQYQICQQFYDVPPLDDLYQLNSLPKAQAFPLFSDFFFCATMTFQARFTCLQAALSGECGLRSVKRWSFCCSIFAAGLTRHTKSHFRTSFPVRCFFRGRNRTDLLDTDTWQLKQ